MAATWHLCLPQLSFCSPKLKCNCFVSAGREMYNAPRGVWRLDLELLRYQHGLSLELGPFEGRHVARRRAEAARARGS